MGRRRSPEGHRTRPVHQRSYRALGHANDAELRALYENCEFFVYPSLYEGWGLPVAEALAFGKFVLASDRGSIPEVGGDLVEYIDPWNASAWAEAISDISTIRRSFKAGQSVFEKNTTRFTGTKLPRR